MIKIENYIELIKALPAQEHCLIVNRSNWETNNNKRSLTIDHDIKARIENLLDLLKFNKDVKKFRISRNDCFQLGEMDGNIELFILAVILWGYKNDRWQTLKKLVTNSALQTYLRKLQRIGIMKSFDELIPYEEIPGLGLSTISKFWYFLKLKIKDNRCMILDDRLTFFFNQKLFEEINFDKRIRRKKILSSDALSDYNNYIKQMNEISKAQNISIDNLEFFLFNFGSTVKPIIQNGN